MDLFSVFNFVQWYFDLPKSVRPGPKWTVFGSVLFVVLILLWFPLMVFLCHVMIHFGIQILGWFDPWYLQLDRQPYLGTIAVVWTLFPGARLVCRHDEREYKKNIDNLQKIEDTLRAFQDLNSRRKQEP